MVISKFELVKLPVELILNKLDVFTKFKFVRVTFSTLRLHELFPSILKIAPTAFVTYIIDPEGDLHSIFGTAGSKFGQQKIL